jgi:diaminohydroxyphosphoribosylaminopyrimidine deaminase/5-amino-6-(5-phosphoribosylamino)uracil reductase
MAPRGLVLVLLSLSVACNTSKESAPVKAEATAPLTSAASRKVFGTPLGTSPTARLADVLKAPDKFAEQSVLVEGGTEIAGAFCDAKLVDKVTFIAAPLIIGGHDAPNAIGGKGASELTEAMRVENISIERLGDDIEITGYPAWTEK